MTMHTPGPWTIKEDINRIEIVGPFDVRVFRYAYAAGTKTIEDVMAGFGFEQEQIPEVVANNARQMADIRLMCASPELFEACKGALASGAIADCGCNCGKCYRCKLVAAIAKAEKSN